MTTDGHKVEHRVALEVYQLVSRSELRLTLKGYLKLADRLGGLQIFVRFFIGFVKIRVGLWPLFRLVASFP